MSMTYIKEMHTKYIDEKNVRLDIGHYQSDPKIVALQAFSAEGEPLCSCTVNLEAYGEIPAPGCVFVYGNYSEHVGVYESLFANGVVGPVIRTIKYGRGDSHAIECLLLV